MRKLIWGFEGKIPLHTQFPWNFLAISGRSNLPWLPYPSVGTGEGKTQQPVLMARLLSTIYRQNKRMKNNFISPTSRTNLDRGDANGGLVSGDKHNRCVLYAGKSSMVADALEMNDQHWTVHAKVANDLTVQIGDSIFQLHQLPMVSKSGYLNRLAFQRGINEEKSTVPKIEINNFPGGAEMFLLVVKFCYGWKVDLTAANIAPAYCAAHFLEMSDDLQHGNFISKTESFLAYLLFASWKDIFQILRSCKTISSWAKELQIVKRCSEAIAWKACLDPRLFTSTSDDDEFAENSQQGRVAENWWFEDISGLRIDHFLEVIELIKRKKIKPELVGSCIAHWTTKWLSQIRFEQHNQSKHLTQRLLGVTAESLIKVLPEEKNSVSCNFLLHLLKLGTMMGISSQLLNHLEKRIALMLEHCSASDLLIKNHGDTDTVYDVQIVARVVKSYSSSVLKNPGSGTSLVGRLVDEYLTMVARDHKLSIENFLLLSEAVPKDARYCNDTLYRAIDMYLKARDHMLAEEERTTICRSMNYLKLSEEARQHAMKNDRLPSCRARLILLEQVNMMKTMMSCGSNFQRTNTQTVIRLRKGLDDGYITSRKEIRLMKKEVENMKMQVNEMQMCRMQLQKQVKGHFVFGCI